MAGDSACPHHVASHGYFSSMVITWSAGTFSSVWTVPLGQVTVSLSMMAAVPRPKWTRPSSCEEIAGAGDALALLVDASGDDFHLRSDAVAVAFVPDQLNAIQ